MRTLHTPEDRFPEFDHRPGCAEVPDGGVDVPGTWWRFRRAVEQAAVVAGFAGKR